MPVSVRTVLTGLVVALGMGALRARAADLTPTVPLQHRVYAFLERCEARGLLPGLRDGVRPFSRLQVAQALGRLDAATAPLPRSDREILRELVVEFSEERRGPDPAGCQQQCAPEEGAGGARRTTMLVLAGREATLVLEPLASHRTDLYTGLGRNEAERIHRSAGGAAVRGCLRGFLGFSSSFVQSMEYGSRTYRIRDDVHTQRLELPQLKGDRADFHEGKAAAIVALPFARLEVAKDDAAWGAAPADNLGLSGNAPSFAMVRLTADCGPVRAVSVHGSLRTCPGRPDSPACWGTVDSARSYIVNGTARTLERRKFLAAHRLEFSLAPWLDVGLQEAVVYGDRGPELLYAIPTMFLWAAQSYLGDKDNVVMGIDLDIHPGRGLRFYGAYLVDDMKKLRILSDDFANKFSAQLGALWTDPAGMDDTALRLEYVRLEPWIYTHRYPINTFSHFDLPLGNSLGPNSNRWRACWEWRPHPKTEIGFEARRTRHGDNVLEADGTVVNVGGDLHLGARAQDSCDRKRFLAGTVAKRTELSWSGRWRPWEQLEIGLEVGREWVSNVPLPPYWDPDTSVALRNRTGRGDGQQTRLCSTLALGVF